jgi:hypothetical protein
VSVSESEINSFNQRVKDFFGSSEKLGGPSSTVEPAGRPDFKAHCDRACEGTMGMNEYIFRARRAID